MTTTIKVSELVRDRLKLQAAREGLTLGTYLASLADLADRQARLQSLRAAMASNPPDADYAAELAWWEELEHG